jgi:hypothetical protein
MQASLVHSFPLSIQTCVLTSPVGQFLSTDTAMSASFPRFFRTLHLLGFLHSQNKILFRAPPTAFRETIFVFLWEPWRIAESTSAVPFSEFIEPDKIREKRICRVEHDYGPYQSTPNNAVADLESLFFCCFYWI